MSWRFWKRPPPQPRALTEQELVELEGMLRHSLKTFLHKVWFIDKETDAIFEREDKVALGNEGIDALVEEFKEYMRTRVKPDGTKN